MAKHPEETNAAAIWRSHELHGVPFRHRSLTKPRRGRRRPVEAFSRTQDAACLWRELKRRGLSANEAATAVQVTFGTARSSLFKPHPIKPGNEAHDRVNAAFVFAMLWRNSEIPHWHRLSMRAQRALEDMRKHPVRAGVAPLPRKTRRARDLFLPDDID